MVDLLDSAEGKPEGTNLDAVSEFFRTRDRVAQMALKTARKMHGTALDSYAREIFSFLCRNVAPGEVFRAYLQRGESLRQLQEAFDRSGSYPAQSASEVVPIPDEQYKLALLVSFVVTSHRFEILKELICFFRMDITGPRELLSIGYGTGYELKLAFDEILNCSALAFDTSPESFGYATELLKFFGFSNACLRQDYYPLDPAKVPPEYQGRFGKAVLCELLEHLDDPLAALKAVRASLADGGLAFCTMAINIAQEDHVFFYRTPEEARDQVLEAGFEIVRELVTPVVILPFDESKRREIFRKGNYVCVARKPVA